MNDDEAPTTVRLAPTWLPTAGRAGRRRGVVAVIVAVAVTGLTACSGGQPDSPHVAILRTTTTTGTGHGGASTTTVSKDGNATELMDEWASCMRANGDPDQTDPIIDQYGVINITLPLGVSSTLSGQVHGSTGPCSQYELDAENDLRAADPVAPPPTQAQILQYVDCMRTHGVPAFPDPGPNGETDFNGTGVDLNSPSFLNANKTCGMQIKAPAWWIAGTGPPGDVSVTSAGIGPHGPTASPPPGDTGTGASGGTGATQGGPGSSG